MSANSTVALSTDSAIAVGFSRSRWAIDSGRMLCSRSSERFRSTVSSRWARNAIAFRAFQREGHGQDEDCVRDEAQHVEGDQLPRISLDHEAETDEREGGERRHHC